MEGFRALLASHDSEAEGVMAMLADPSLNEGEEAIEDLAALLAQFESAVVAGEPSLWLAPPAGSGIGPACTPPCLTRLEASPRCVLVSPI